MNGMSQSTKAAARRARRSRVSSFMQSSVVKWAFYAREKDGNEHLIPRPASCYTCHEEHAAVDTTFTQFYPTLLPIAKANHVLSANYIADQAATAGK